MLTQGKVILFYPPYDGPPLGAPLCLLALAASLREADFDVVMIDAAIEPDYLARIECESVDALCIGISVLTGPMIRGAIEVATAAKSQSPWLPIIFGGWHPSLLPDETLSEPFVDMVVRGQGEVTIVEIAQALAHKKSLNNIAGLSWKNNGQRTHNLDRKVEPLDNLPIPAFDLTNFDAYEKLCGIRKLAYATSVGGEPEDVEPTQKRKRTRRGSLIAPEEPGEQLSREEFQELVRDLDVEGQPTPVSTPDQGRAGRSAGAGVAQRAPAVEPGEQAEGPEIEEHRDPAADLTPEDLVLKDEPRPREKRRRSGPGGKRRKHGRSR